MLELGQLPGVFRGRIGRLAHLFGGGGVWWRCLGFCYEYGEFAGRGECSCYSMGGGKLGLEAEAKGVSWSFGQSERRGLVSWRSRLDENGFQVCVTLPYNNGRKW